MPFKTFNSLAEASKETGIPTGKLYSMARSEKYPKIYLETSPEVFGLKIDGIYFEDAWDIEDELGIKQKDFFLYLEKSSDFTDKDGVSHRVHGFIPISKRF